MSKNTPAKPAVVDLSRFCKSSFTLTFAIEVLGLDVWHDCNEGWLDLGPCSQGIKIQYQLYPGQTFDADILIWPHAAKIWVGSQYGWVRTWQFLERRFLTFTIRHLFPVRVSELRGFTATITPIFGIGSLGANAKNDKNVEVFLPPLKFREQRYFAPIIEGEQSLTEFIWNLIWKPVIRYIPANFMDGLFDVPQVVSGWLNDPLSRFTSGLNSTPKFTVIHQLSGVNPLVDSLVDPNELREKYVRHQDAIMFQVREAIFNTNKIPEDEEIEEPEEPKIKDRRESKMIKDKEKEKEKKKPAEVPKVKFEIKLLGDSILAGIGRIVPFEKYGDRPSDLGEIIALISSDNLPAQDDMPVIFVNVETLTGVPLDTFRKYRISQIYTRWEIGEEGHNSEPQTVRSIKNEVNFNDHHALPLDPAVVSEITAEFLDIPFEIQLRGIRTIPIHRENPKFFGYQKGDHDFGTNPSRKIADEDTDILIAVTRIDGRAVTKGVNKFLRGDYPLFPPTVSVVDLEREGICTNDINRIKAPLNPVLVVPSYLILEAQMNLEVSIGFVGCKSKKLADSYSRLYCLINDTECIMAILRMITEINEDLLQVQLKDESLTGFALDAGSLVILYVEGPRDGEILRVWEMTEDFYPRVKPVFSTSARYSTRIYPELLHAAMPFYILKMYVPLGVLLACPPIYARPALPLPTRSTLLKLGRLVAGKMRTAPTRCALPTAAELKSFRLELCVTPKPMSSIQNEEVTAKYNAPLIHATNLSLQKINWTMTNK